jgi:hypothetical protein
MQKTMTSIVLLSLLWASGCALMVSNRIAELKTLYQQGAISRHYYVTEVGELLSQNARSSEEREYAAYFKLQASKWLRDEISREQFNYLVTVKENELAERRRQQKLTFSEWKRRNRRSCVFDEEHCLEIYRAEMGLPKDTVRCVSTTDIFGRVITECR